MNRTWELLRLMSHAFRRSNSDLYDTCVDELTEKLKRLHTAAALLTVSLVVNVVLGTVALELSIGRKPAMYFVGSCALLVLMLSTRRR